MIRGQLIAWSSLVPRTSPIVNLAGALMEKLTQLLDSIDSAYRVAATTDRDIASLLLLASLNVSQKIEAASDRSEGRRCKAA
jgi:hypothetical protein